VRFIKWCYDIGNPTEGGDKNSRLSPAKAAQLVVAKGTAQGAQMLPEKGLEKGRSFGLSEQLPHCPFKRQFGLAPGAFSNWYNTNIKSAADDVGTMRLQYIRPWTGAKQLGIRAMEVAQLRSALGGFGADTTGQNAQLVGGLEELRRPKAGDDDEKEAGKKDGAEGAEGGGLVGMVVVAALAHSGRENRTEARGRSNLVAL
jgi:hypothetical protein